MSKEGITAQKIGAIAGKGSHGVMYKCKLDHPDTKDSIAVALKEYSVPAQSSDEGKEVQEGAVIKLMETAQELLALAPHPNVLRYYGVEFVKGQTHRELDRVLITQDFVESSQSQRGIKGPIKDEDELKKIARGLVGAVAHLHGAGVTHDDIRPVNVFRSMTTGSNGEAPKEEDLPAVLLTDYGLFKPVTMLFDPSTGQVTTQQKPQYAAPEIFTDGNDYDPFKVDVWAVGATLLEIHTGKPPYYELDPKGTGAIMFKIVNGRKPPAFGTEASAGFKALLEQCFTWSGDDRPSIEDIMEHEWLN